VVIVAGKGGVGKTTVTAALARTAAAEGMDALIVEVEGKSGLSALFDRPQLSYEESILWPRGGAEGEVRGRTLTPDDALLEYLLAAVRETRSSPFLTLGVSPRGAIAWYRAAQSFALIDGRHYCIPDDLKQLALPVLAHRVVLASQSESGMRAHAEAEQVLDDILRRVSIPL
jgi:MoxR-like ATPase